MLGRVYFYLIVEPVDHAHIHDVVPIGVVGDHLGFRRTAVHHVIEGQRQVDVLEIWVG